MIFEFGPNVVLRPPHARFRIPPGAPAGPKLDHWRQGPTSGGKSFWNPEPPRSTPLLPRTPDPRGRRIPKACGPCRRPQRITNFARDHMLCSRPFCVMCRNGTAAPAPTAADPGPENEDPLDRLMCVTP